MIIIVEFSFFCLYRSLNLVEFTCSELFASQNLLLYMR